MWLSLNVLRIASKNIALSNSVRRTVWLKPWMGDAISKNNFCSLPFEPGRLFSIELDKLLKADENIRILGFPQGRPRPSFRFCGFRRSGAGNSTNTYRGRQQP